MTSGQDVEFKVMQLCREGSTRRGHHRIAMDQKSWTNQKSVDQSEPGVEPGQHRQFYVINERPQASVASTHTPGRKGSIRKVSIVELHKPVSQTQEISGSRAQ